MAGPHDYKNFDNFIPKMGAWLDLEWHDIILTNFRLPTYMDMKIEFCSLPCLLTEAL
jgi:hypothetical protein